MRKDARVRAAAFILASSLAAVLLLVAPPEASPGAPQRSHPAGAEFLPGFTLAVPPGSRVAARLVVPPADEATLEKLSWTGTTFAVGPGDAVWFDRDGEVLVNFTKGYRVRLSEPFSDIAAIGGGALLIAGRETLGFLAPGSAAGGAAGGETTAAVQPIFSLPVDDARLSAGENGALYLFGTGKESGRKELFLVLPEPVSSPLGAGKSARRIRKIFSTTEKLSAAAGDGRDSFVAAGRLVLKVGDGPERLSVVFLHPREEITDLAFSRAHGLFYATPSGVGCVGPQGSVEFLHAPNASIRLVNGDLYVFLKNSLAVVKVEGIGTFRKPPAAGPKP